MTIRRVLTPLLAAAALLVSAASATAAAPSLSVSGNRLVDTSTGAVFVPRGVNFPSFEYACFYGYGYSNEAGPASVGPTAAQARLIAGWHANTVRVPLNQDCWLGDDGAPGGGLTATGYRDAVAAWVARLHDAGLAVILDLHWTGPNGVPAEGQRMMADDRSPAFWASVAERFRDDRAVMFDAFNEPYSRFYDAGSAFPLSWACWRDGGCAVPRQNDMSGPFDGATFATTGMQALVAAIRGAGATQPILLGGLDYANDLREWLASRPADGQLVASFHNYDGQRCSTVACWDAEIAPVAAQVPVVAGEFGETDCSPAHDQRWMSWADAHGVGYLAWQWVVLAPSERANPACASLVLIEDVAGTPAAPNGTALKAHLAALAGGPGAPGTGDRVAPKVTRAALRRLRGVVRLTATFSEPATLKLVLRTRRGRAVATATGTVRAGRRTVAVTGRRLAAGRYRLYVTARDRAGNRARTRVIALRVR
ncbi:MAG: glycoside hydrolase family 5 protein [Thermoleophilia bacterium]